MKMSEPNDGLAIIRFGDFEADLTAGSLRCRGAPVALRGQAFDILAVLLRRAGQVVTREDLRHLLWPDGTFVDFDGNLNTLVARLREALHDSAEHPQFIETVPRRGYRFLGTVASIALPRSPSERPRLLVLPLVNSSGDAGEEYFVDAMTDEIITDLASVTSGRLAVIARTTTMRYKGAHQDIASIARELSVDFVLEGSVRRANDRIGMNVQLIRASDETHVFARRYEKMSGEIIALHRAIADDVAGEIDPWFRPEGNTGEAVAGARRSALPSVSIPAYHRYLQGRHRLYEMLPHSFAAAREHFEAAIALDPNFALAYDALGEVHWWIGFLGLARPRDAFYAGTWAAARALELDANLAESHALLGRFRKELDYNWTEVDREMARALELNPGSPVVLERNAISALMPRGRIAEAIRDLERALEVDPLSGYLRFWLSELSYLGRDNARAMDEARLLIQLDPSLWFGHFALGQIQIAEADWAEAISALREAAERSGGSPITLGFLAMALAKAGDRDAAGSLLAQLRAAAGQTYVPPTSLAVIHLGLGDIDEAFACMENAIEERDPLLIPIRTYPFLDPLRSHARFTALLAKMHLEETVPSHA